MDVRRTDRRYAVDVDLHYKVRRRKGVEQGVGRTVNISNSGILFRSDKFVPVGIVIELSLAWPSHRNNGLAPKVWVNGQTVRVQDGSTAVRILDYQFRSAD